MLIIIWRCILTFELTAWNYKVIRRKTDLHLVGKIHFKSIKWKVNFFLSLVPFYYKILLAPLLIASWASFWKLPVCDSSHVCMHIHFYLRTFFFIYYILESSPYPFLHQYIIFNGCIIFYSVVLLKRCCLFNHVPIFGFESFPGSLVITENGSLNIAISKSIMLLEIFL